MREIIQPEKNEEDTYGEIDRWHCEPEIVSAVWTLIGICGSNDEKVVRELVADFISRVCRYACIYQFFFCLCYHVLYIHI